MIPNSLPYETAQHLARNFSVGCPIPPADALQLVSVGIDVELMTEILEDHHLRPGNLIDYARDIKRSYNRKAFLKKHGML